jgi:hypothetical protein
MPWMTIIRWAMSIVITSIQELSKGFQILLIFLSWLRKSLPISQPSCHCCTRQTYSFKNSFFFSGQILHYVPQTISLRILQLWFLFSQQLCNTTTLLQDCFLTIHCSLFKIITFSLLRATTIFLHSMFLIGIPSSYLPSKWKYFHCKLNTNFPIHSNTKTFVSSLKS